MLHNVLLIGLHTAAASLSFLAGAVVLRPRDDRGWQFSVYQISLIVAIVLVIVIIGVDWATLAALQRAIFSGLAVLGIYMVWRALLAGRSRRLQRSGWQNAYVSHVGFTLISLFDAFVIVLAIDLGAPGWLVAVVALFGVAAGIAIIRKVQQGIPA